MQRELQALSRSFSGKVVCMTGSSKHPGPKMKRKKAEPSQTPTQQLLEQISCWCRASRSLTALELQTLFSVVEGLKAGQAQQIVADLEDLGPEPVLLQYSSDTTPAVIRKSTTCQAPGISVRRRVQSSYEFIVQNLLFTWHSASGHPRTHIYLAEPSPLLHGKTMAAMCACASELHLLRVSPPSAVGIRVFHQVYDRCVGQELFHGVAGLWQQHGVAEPSSSSPVDPEASSSSTDLFQWTTYTACAAHDCYNALKWSSFNIHGSQEILSNVYAAVAAYRFCYSSSLDHLASWLGNHLQGLSPTHLPDPITLENLWLHLGVAEDLARTLSTDIRLHWTGSKLQVQESFLEAPDWLSTLSASLMSIWSFQSFSATRWLSVGRACRGLLRALVSGFISFVAFLKRQKGISSYYTAGTEKVGEAEWKFIAVTAFSAYLPEALVSALLEDSRLPQQLPELEAQLMHQFMDLMDLDESVWCLIRPQLGKAGNSLRSDVVTALLVAWSFMHFRMLDRAGRYPWKLTHGDIPANLRALAAESEPSEVVTCKIWKLLQAGYNMNLLVKGVRLLGQCSWTTHLAEKQHSGISVVKRHHPALQASALAARGYLHLARQMLSGPTAEQRAVARWEKRWQRLQSAVPNRVSGRHVFLQDVMMKARYAEEHGQRRKSTFDRNKIMRLHGSEWQALPEAQQQQYQHRAEYARSAAMRRHAQALEDALADGSKLQSELQQSEATDPAPNLLRAGVMSPETLAGVTSFLAGPRNTPAGIKRLRKQAESCPPPLSPDTMQRLCSRSSLDLISEKMPLPRWARQVCAFRDFFRTSVFAIRETEAVVHYRFLFALLKPASLMLLPLQQQFPRHDYGPTPDTWQTDLVKDLSFYWSWSAGDFAGGDVFGDVDAELVHVHADSFINSSGQVQSLDMPVPLLSVLQGLDADAEESEKTAQTDASIKPVITSGSSSTGSYKKHAWATLVNEAGSSSSCVAGDKPVASSSQAAPLTATDVTDKESQLFDDLFQELRANRDTLPGLGPDMRSFKISLAGDPRLVGKKGPTVHGALASLRSGVPIEEFASRVGLKKSARFECSVYTQEGALVLARAWCDRMQFLHDLWCRRAGESWPYTADALSEYKPPDELSQLMETWSDRQCKRARQVMSMQPEQ